MAKTCKPGYYWCYTDKKCKKIPVGWHVGRGGMIEKDDEETKKNNENGESSEGNGGENGGGVSEEVVSEKRDGKSAKDPGYSLRDWFRGGGWKQTGGKYDGKPCAKQPGQKTKPFCRDADDRAAMSKDERDRRASKKRKEDPNPDRKGKAKMVSSSYQPEGNNIDERADFWDPDPKKDRRLGGPGANQRAREDGASSDSTPKKDYSKSLKPGETYKQFADRKKAEKMRKEEKEELRYCPKCKKAERRSDCSYGTSYWDNNALKISLESAIEEAKGKKDACYHKVKSRYDVWPSAYASGALVKCRKVGAKNWGNKTESKDHEYSMARSQLSTVINAARRLKEKMKGEGNIEAWVQSKITKAADYLDSAADYVDSGEMNEAKKCWPGYKKKGTQKLFGKTYNRCVKANEQLHYDGDPDEYDDNEEYRKDYRDGVCPYCGCDPCECEGNEMNEAVRIPAKTGNLLFVMVTWRGKGYSLKMFFPQAKRPTRKEVELEVQKVYPGGRVRYMEIANIKPGEQFLQVSEGAAWTKKAGKSDSGGLNEKGRKSYERENPGSDLKAPSKKVGNKRRASFCARMKGMKKKLTSAKTANDPDSRINKSLRAWNC